MGSPKRGVDGPRPVGSDFEEVEPRFLVGSHQPTLPWASGGLVHLQSGRQALSLVRDSLERAGVGTLYAADYVCESVVTPFVAHGWRLVPLPVDSDLRVPLELIGTVRPDGAFLDLPYFGRTDTSRDVVARERLRQAGVPVIVDETHRIFAGPSAAADFRVASLRKLLPLYDGGYAWSAPGWALGTPGPSVPEVAAARAAAMRAKSAALAAGKDPGAVREQFQRAERVLEAAESPTRMSGASAELLRNLDLAKISAVRQKNATTLHGSLSSAPGYRVVNPPSPDVAPSHLLVQTVERDALRDWLRRASVFCPVHWPPHELMVRATPWPGTYLSLPVDHRYDDDDMLRVASLVNEFFSTRKV